MRYFLNISFTGTGFHGWQLQRNSPNTIQAVCNAAVSRILQHPVRLTGCGRTDAGVHATEFFAHFDSPVDLPAADKKKWLFKFNSVLPQSIAVRDIFKVQETANARFSAVSRTYRYVITTCKDPFRLGFAYFVPVPLNMELMNRAAFKLRHFNDFSSFKKAHTQNKTDHCTIIQAGWKAESSLLIFTVTADRFLRNMVRCMVGTMIAVGKGKLSVDDFCRIIESRNRSHAGASVPACGLFLTKVEYPRDIFESGEGVRKLR